MVCRHEIVGEVTEIGSKARKVQVGDKVGVGCLVGACHSCQNCNNDLENYCPKRIFTYTSIYYDGTATYGGYSDHIVANERYVVRFPNNMPLDASAPLLCGGITVYSPLKYFGLAEQGKHVGVVGLGGLGHLAVKFAKAFGAEVTVISTSINKKDEALKNLGANSFLVSHDQEQMEVTALHNMLLLVNNIPISSTKLLCNLRINEKNIIFLFHLIIEVSFLFFLDIYI